MRKKVGRPTVDDPRNGHIVIRVNKAEAAAIRKAAKNAKLKLGQYVRSKLLGE